MGGEGTRAKAANRRGANRGRPRRGAAFVRSDRGDRDDCGSCSSCGRARVRRDARPRRDVRFAFWRSNARHHSNPRETTPSAASPRSDIARVARLQVCGRASAFGAASARTRTHAGVPRTRRRFGRALFGSLISNGVTSADVMVAAAVADARCRPRSRRVARLRRRSAERGARSAEGAAKHRHIVRGACMPTVSFGHPPFYFFVHGRDDVRVEASARRQRARRGNRHRRDAGVDRQRSRQLFMLGR